MISSRHNYKHDDHDNWGTFIKNGRKIYFSSYWTPLNNVTLLMTKSRNQRKIEGRVRNQYFHTSLWLFDQRIQVFSRVSNMNWRTILVKIPPNSRWLKFGWESTIDTGAIRFLVEQFQFEEESIRHCRITARRPTLLRKCIFLQFLWCVLVLPCLFHYCT